MSKRRGEDAAGYAWEASCNTFGVWLTQYVDQRGDANPLTPAGARELAKALMELAYELETPDMFKGTPEEIVAKMAASIGTIIPAADANKAPEVGSS